ncbi:DUF3887 domain-containing protein [Rothia nasimurium]|uniref:DUF3887 domain-containing protein n=1 Tax=Rothia nasimurium TaxID=85336 RepID=UPI001F260499|nr:DUF3887 domain-containing protein [Rothia nasimurium]
MENLPTQLENIALAQEAAQDSEHYLNHCVAVAKKDGYSWGEIGSVLGISRQAAAQKYSKIVQEIAPMQFSEATQAHLNNTAKSVLYRVSEQDWEKVHSYFSFTAKRGLGKKKLAEVWQEVLNGCGEFQRVDSINLHAPSPHEFKVFSATVKIPNSSIFAIADFTLEHTDGKPVGQIAFNSSRKVIGFLIYLNDSAELPW